MDNVFITIFQLDTNQDAALKEVGGHVIFRYNGFVIARYRAGLHDEHCLRHSMGSSVNGD